MRRSSKGSGRRTTTKRQAAITGTIKSVERERGTGSIAPDRDGRLHADTGFARTVVDGIDFNTLAVGDRVQFDAVLASDRPGDADATVVRADTGEGDDDHRADEGPETGLQQLGRPAATVLSAAEQAVRNQDAALASGEENPG
jgi:cold shock CspA family protein